MKHTARNIRAALAGIPMEDRIDLHAAISMWVDDGNRPAIRLHDLAMAALVENKPLKDLPCAASYSTDQQRRAYATASLLAAIWQISDAYQRKSENATVRAAMAQLEGECNRLAIENKAAWRAAKIEVPFRKPRPKSVNWMSEAVEH